MKLRYHPKAGVQIPSRKKDGKLFWAKPTTSRMTFILTHRAYTGAYVFAKTQSQPGGPVRARGQSKRIKLPEDRWIKHANHHPAYMTVEEQVEIKVILAKNQFTRRYRAGRGPALIQGLLRCRVCGASLMVTYTKRGYYFVCRRSREYAEKACLSFCCNDLDEKILREVFKILQAPPIDMIRAALEQSRSKIQTRLHWIESERERLAHEERLAEERAKLAAESFPRVQRAALAKLEKIMNEKEEFEQKIAFEESARANDASEEELAELCRIAADVPALFQHELGHPSGEKRNCALPDRSYCGHGRQRKNRCNGRLEIRRQNARVCLARPQPPSPHPRAPCATTDSIRNQGASSGRENVDRSAHKYECGSNPVESSKDGSFSGKTFREPSRGAAKGGRSSISRVSHSMRLRATSTNRA